MHYSKKHVAGQHSRVGSYGQATKGADLSFDLNSLSTNDNSRQMNFFLNVPFDAASGASNNVHDHSFDAAILEKRRALHSNHQQQHHHAVHGHNRSFILNTEPDRVVNTKGPLIQNSVTRGVAPDERHNFSMLQRDKGSHHNLTEAAAAQYHQLPAPPPVARQQKRIPSGEQRVARTGSKRALALQQHQNQQQQQQQQKGLDSRPKQLFYFDILHPEVYMRKNQCNLERDLSMLRDIDQRDKERAYQHLLVSPAKRNGTYAGGKQGNEVLKKSRAGALQAGGSQDGSNASTKLTQAEIYGSALYDRKFLEKRKKRSISHNAGGVGDEASDRHVSPKNELQHIQKTLTQKRNLCMAQQQQQQHQQDLDSFSNHYKSSSSRNGGAQTHKSKVGGEALFMLAAREGASNKHSLKPNNVKSQSELTDVMTSTAGEKSSVAQSTNNNTNGVGNVSSANSSTYKDEIWKRFVYSREQIKQSSTSIDKEIDKINFLQEKNDSALKRLTQLRENMIDLLKGSTAADTVLQSTARRIDKNKTPTF